MPASSGAELGLTISKRAVDQMEGQLTLHSQPGLGSIFTITLHTAELALEHP
jgi:signal transduction histidine kinase